MNDGINSNGFMPGAVSCAIASAGGYGAFFAGQNTPIFRSIASTSDPVVSKETLDKWLSRGKMNKITKEQLRKAIPRRNLLRACQKARQVWTENSETHDKPSACQEFVQKYEDLYKKVDLTRDRGEGDAPSKISALNLKIHFHKKILHMLQSLNKGIPLYLQVVMGFFVGTGGAAAFLWMVFRVFPITFHQTGTQEPVL